MKEVNSFLGFSPSNPSLVWSDQRQWMGGGRPCNRRAIVSLSGILGQIRHSVSPPLCWLLPWRACMCPELFAFTDMRTRWKGILWNADSWCVLCPPLRCVQFGTTFKCEPSVQEVSPESLVTCFS